MNLLKDIITIPRNPRKAFLILYFIFFLIILSLNLLLFEFFWIFNLLLFILVYISFTIIGIYYKHIIKNDIYSKKINKKEFKKFFLIIFLIFFLFLFSVIESVRSASGLLFTTFGFSICLIIITYKLIRINFPYDLKKEKLIALIILIIAGSNFTIISPMFATAVPEYLIHYEMNYYDAIKIYNIDNESITIQGDISNNELIYRYSYIIEKGNIEIKITGVNNYTSFSITGNDDNYHTKRNTIQWYLLDKEMEKEKDNIINSIENKYSIRPSDIKYYKHQYEEDAGWT